MTRTSDTAAALAYLDALGGEDPERVWRLVSDGFRNEHQAELGSGSVGRSEYAQRLPTFFASFPNRRYTIVETAVGALMGVDGSAGDGTEVIARYRFGADAGRGRLDIPGVMWISVSNGVITRRVDTWDSLTYFRQTGTTPPPAD